MAMNIDYTYMYVWCFEDGDSGVLSQDFNYAIIFYTATV